VRYRCPSWFRHLNASFVGLNWHSPAAVYVPFFAHYVAPKGGMTAFHYE